MIKGFFKGLAAFGAAVMAMSPALATAYLPVGPQTNVPLSTVLSGGWSLCYSASYATALGGSANDEIAQCGGTNIMLAARVTGSDTLLLLAEAPRADVTFNTGANSNVVHVANGAAWYDADNYSIGFSGIGEQVTKNQCDTAAGADKLCWHTIAPYGGYRIGDITNLNNSTGYEKLIFSYDGAAAVAAVPEPASWMMMLVGFGLLGASLRRRSARGAAMIA